MERTLLYTVQRVLEKLSLDPVVSINDTEDALLISREAESTFYDFMTRAEWPDKVDLIEVTSLSDITNPTSVLMEGDIHHISSVRYDVTTSEDNSRIIRELYWIEPEEFLEKSYSLNSEEDSVTEADYNGKVVLVRNDRMPTYYTSFDNKTLVFDSHHSATEDTIIGTKTVCYGKSVPSWLQDDNFVIPVQDSLYPLYLAMLSSACSIYLTSQPSQEDERRQMRGMSRMRREAYRTEMEYFPKFRYGRKGNGLA